MRNSKASCNPPSRTARHLCLVALFLVYLTGISKGETLEIYGRTFDRDGNIAADVMVEVVITDMRTRRPVGTESTRSTGLGEFYFDLTRQYGAIPRLGLDFRTSSPRFRQQTLIRVAGQEEFPVEVFFELPPGITARGQVLTEEGEPMAEAFLRGGDDRPWTTDSEGRFEIYGLFPDRRNAIQVSREGMASITKIIDAPASGSVEDIIITVPTATPIEGVVLTPHGEPVSGGIVTARLDLVNRFWREPIDSQGRFRFPAIPYFTDEAESLRVTAWAHDYLETDITLISTDLEKLGPLELRLGWGVLLQGGVHDPAGVRLGGGTVTVGDGRTTRIIRNAVDERGTWRLGPFKPGEEVLLTAIPPLPRRGTFIADIVFDETEGHIDRWSYGPSSTIRLTRSDGDEIRMVRHDSGPGAVPGVIVYQGHMSGDWEGIEGTLSVESTGATGTFTMRPHHRGGRLRGDWELRETVEGGEPLAAPIQRRLRLAPLEGKQVITLALTSPTELEGRAVDEAGNALRSGFVRLTEWNRTHVYQMDVPISTDGTFRLTGLPADGVLTLLLLDASRTHLAEPVYLRSGLKDVLLQAGFPPDDPITEWRADQ